METAAESPIAGLRRRLEARRPLGAAADAADDAGGERAALARPCDGLRR
jgi:hypothetical protein